MRSALPVAALLLLAVTGTDGIKCIACRPNSRIAGTSFPAEIEDIVRKLPRCAQLNVKDPQLEYEMQCPSGYNSCAKIRDERGNEIRSCFKSKKTSCSTGGKKGQVFCTCRGDFCNSGETSAPALLSLFLPLAAALLWLH